MSRYADASFLGSLYAMETTTGLALEFLQHDPSPILVSAFAEFELVNAIQLRVFRQQFTVAEAAGVLKDIREDFDRHLFLSCTLPDHSLERAQELSRNRTKDLGTRAGDVLHVAIALELKAEWFLTFDKRQQQLAKVEGFKVIALR